MGITAKGGKGAKGDQHNDATTQRPERDFRVSVLGREWRIRLGVAWRGWIFFVLGCQITPNPKDPLPFWPNVVKIVFPSRRRVVVLTWFHRCVVASLCHSPPLRALCDLRCSPPRLSSQWTITSFFPPREARGSGGLRICRGFPAGFCKNHIPQTSPRRIGVRCRGSS